mmetsp:Transcript_3874/g.8891  ORF Transcript_3874/g.8891 Transcript_3874/m.8891 type:complete len:208 (+) Transcript_3874:1073-1696(+)
MSNLGIGDIGADEIGSSRQWSRSRSRTSLHGHGSPVATIIVAHGSNLDSSIGEKRVRNRKIFSECFVLLVEFLVIGRDSVKEIHCKWANSALDEFACKWLVLVVESCKVIRCSADLIHCNWLVLLVEILALGRDSLKEIHGLRMNLKAQVQRNRVCCWGWHGLVNDDDRSHDGSIESNALWWNRRKQKGTDGSDSDGKEEGKLGQHG